jgi:hypothetical protein
MTDGSPAIIKEIFDSAAARPDLASLVGPLKALWKAGEWKAESIVDAVQAIDFGTIKAREDEAS